MRAAATAAHSRDRRVRRTAQRPGRIFGPSCEACGQLAAYEINATGGVACPVAARSVPSVYSPLNEGGEHRGDLSDG
jgi:hypothetical protein